MDATTKASRAVLAEYARKTLRPIELIAVIVFVLATLGTSWLIMSTNGWWWLLMIIVIAYGVIGSLIWLVIHYTLDKIRPQQTPQQISAVKQFIKQLNTVSEIVGLTKFGLLLRVISDVMRRREQNVLTDFAHDSSKLKTDFEKLIKLF